jgi:uncharacterized protein YciI
MPLFAVHALDAPSALPLRLEHYTAHRAYIETDQDHGLRIVLSGPLQSDDGQTMIGSLFIIEAESASQVADFVGSDPFNTARVWATLKITRFHKRKG